MHECVIMHTYHTRNIHIPIQDELLHMFWMRQRFVCMYGKKLSPYIYIHQCVELVQICINSQLLCLEWIDVFNHIHTFKYIYIYIYIHTHTHVCICIYIHTYYMTCTYIRECNMVLNCFSAHSHTDTHSHTHTLTHTHTNKTHLQSFR
jgi:hypothetical protein